MILRQIIPETMYQISSEFYRRYYKNILISFFPDTTVSCDDVQKLHKIIIISVIINIFFKLSLSFSNKYLLKY